MAFGKARRMKFLLMSKRNVRIVIVDDDLTILPLYEAIGEIENTTVIVRQSAIGALSFLHEVNYEVDAIVTDLSMPDMSGITLTKQIRENEDLRFRDNPIKIYWLTGWGYDEKDINNPIVLAAKEFNIEKVYLKPHDPTAIVNEIKGLFE